MYLAKSFLIRTMDKSQKPHFLNTPLLQPATFKYKAYIIWMAKVKEQLQYQMQFQSLALHLRTVQMCCWLVFTTIPQALHVASTYLWLSVATESTVQSQPSSRRNEVSTDQDLLAQIQHDYSGLKLTRLSQTTPGRLTDPASANLGISAAFHQPTATCYLPGCCVVV